MKKKNGPVVDATLNHSAVPWKVLGLVLDIRMFLNASTCLLIMWISHVANNAVHEGAKWAFNVTGNDLRSMIEIQSSVK